MDRNQIKAIMNDIYTSSEAAEYLQISTQRLNQLVHDKQIEPIKVSKSIMLFLKEDLEKRKMYLIIKIQQKQECLILTMLMFDMLFYIIRFNNILITMIKRHVNI